MFRMCMLVANQRARTFVWDVHCILCLSLQSFRVLLLLVKRNLCLFVAGNEKLAFSSCLLEDVSWVIQCILLFEKKNGVLFLQPFSTNSQQPERFPYRVSTAHWSFGIKFFSTCGPGQTCTRWSWSSGFGPLQFASNLESQDFRVL